jgi:hypothetical protein
VAAADLRDHPARVARRADAAREGAGRVAAPRAAHGKPVVAIAGRVSLPAGALAGRGHRARYALSDVEPDLARSMAGAGPLLEKLAGRVASDWLAGAAGTEPRCLSGNAADRSPGEEPDHDWHAGRRRPP